MKLNVLGAFVEFNQEMKNLILDLKDQVNKHSKTINQLAKISNARKEVIEKLEAKIQKLETNHKFKSDIFGGGPLGR